MAEFYSRSPFRKISTSFRICCDIPHGLAQMPTSPISAPPFSHFFASMMSNSHKALINHPLMRHSSASHSLADKQLSTSKVGIVWSNQLPDTKRPIIRRSKAIGMREEPRKYVIFVQHHQDEWENEKWNSALEWDHHHFHALISKTGKRHKWSSHPKQQNQNFHSEFEQKKTARRLNSSTICDHRIASLSQINYEVL